MTSPSKIAKNTCMLTDLSVEACGGSHRPMWQKVKWFLHHIAKMSSRMLDWMDKTHKTVYFHSVLWPSQRLKASHGYNHKAGLLWLYREWVTLDWHKHKWPTITWKCMMYGWNYWVSKTCITPKFQTLTIRNRHSWKRFLEELIVFCLHWD